MILKKQEIALIRRGRPWFTLPMDPGWEPGRVVRLRSSRKDEGLVITVRDVQPDDRRFKVRFTYGDGRPERRYLSASWPDYTSDPGRAMRNELPPMPEAKDEETVRRAWLALALGAGVDYHDRPRRKEKKPWESTCKWCGGPLKPPPRPPGAPPRPRPTYCSDKCTLLAAYEARRGA